MADDAVFPWSIASALYTMVDSKPIYFLVIASQDRFYDCVKILSSGKSMTSFHVAIFQPTSTTSLTRVMNLGDVKAQLAAGPPYLQTIMLPDPLDAAAGERFYVGLLSVGGTPPDLANCASYISLGYGWGETGTTPHWGDISALDTGTQTSFGNTTETIDSLVGYPPRIWGALGNAVEPLRLPAFFTDNFNQINMSQVVLPWSGRSAVQQFGIYNQTMSPQTGATGAFNYWVPSVRNDDHYVQVKLGADMATDVGRNINLYLGVRGARGGTGTSVKLHIDPSGTRVFRIVTVTTAYNNGGLVQRAAADPVPEFVQGDVVKLVADGSVYAAFHNDDPIVSWDDSGVLAPVDADHQRVNIAASATSTANLELVDNFEAGAYGGGVQLLSMSGIPSAEVFGALQVGNNIVLTPGAASLSASQYAPTLRTGSDLRPGNATLTVTTFAPKVTVSGTTVEIDTVRNNVAVPANVAGCWVTLQGGGGAGGSVSGTDQNGWQYGGGGGGGGGRIRRSWVPAAALGATYSVAVGAAGSGSLGGNGGDGGASTFISGSVSLSAGGGKGGGYASGTTYPSSSYGTGGVVSFSGVTPDYQNGSAGSPYGVGNNSTYGGGGGGSGGLINSFGSGVAAYNGNGGGSTSGAAGTTGGNSHGAPGNASSDSTLYGGGGAAGGAGWSGGANFLGGLGGSPGGGGGGAGPTAQTPTNSGGDGGIGTTIIEWIIDTEL